MVGSPLPFEKLCSTPSGHVGYAEPLPHPLRRELPSVVSATLIPLQREPGGLEPRGCGIYGAGGMRAAPTGVRRAAKADYPLCPLGISPKGETLAVAGVEMD